MKFISNLSKHVFVIIIKSQEKIKPVKWSFLNFDLNGQNFAECKNQDFTRGVFYVRRKVDLMKTAKVNAYILHIFGKIELLSIHAT